MSRDLLHAPRRTSSLTGAAVCIAALASGAGLTGCHRVEPPPAQPQAVTIATVEKAAGSAASRFSGNIEPATRLDLAFKVGGYVESIAKTAGVDGSLRILQEGDAVREGQELASLRRTDYAQKLAEAQASLLSAKAAAEQADLDFARGGKLAERGAMTGADLDAIKTKLASAKATLAGAQARVDEAATALSDTVLRAPMSGVLLRRNVEVGTLAAPGTVAFVIADVRSVKAVFGVSDTMLSRVQLGAAQSVTTEAYPGVEFRGRITRISPSADPKSRVFEAEVGLPNPDGKLKSGMVVALGLSADASPAESTPLVPLSAVVRPPKATGGFAVFVVDDGAGKPVARMRVVELGDYLGRVIPVKRGLREGERVVVSGAGLLSDGEPIEIVPTEVQP
jgi:RND family efflux transporter MFP subunit